jgi:ATP-dependent Clp protease ATP-binding subunit ClpA
MLKMDRQLAMQLRSQKVRIDVPSVDTVLFRNVPVSAGCFSKPSTNLLLKRPRTGLPFVVCVDEDLEYVGGDAVVQRVFAGDVKRAGWKTLRLTLAPEEPFGEVVRDALAVLGFGRDEPELRPTDPSGDSERRGLLASHGTDLSEQARQGRCEPTIGRETEVAEVVSAVLRFGQCRLALITGPSGVGKTNLLHASASLLMQRRPTCRLLCVDLAPAFAGSLFESDREASLASLLTQGLSEGAILALEHLELALTTPQGTLLLARALDDGLGVIGTVLPEYRNTLRGGVLERRVQVVDLREPGAGEAAAMVFSFRDRIADHHRVEVDEVCVKAGVRASEPLVGCLPAKAIDLLDAAAARAALCGARVVTADDVYHAAGMAEH